MSDPLDHATVAVLGFGHQGEAQALNLRDSSVPVVVGAREGAGAARARAQGLEVLGVAEAARRAQVVAVMLPDEALPALWPSLATAMAPETGLVFAHGFNLVYSDLAFPARGDVVLVSPTGPGRVLREAYRRGDRLPAYIAAHRDRSGKAMALAEAYAARIGAAPLWRTTPREETEVDLFGEQVVLCGGLLALVTAAHETLVERGYSPEIAYLECVHQLKYLADLLHERGPAGFRAGISGTALYGAMTRGPRVVGRASREEMKAILEEIRSGAFAREWAAEAARGPGRLAVELERAREHPIEEARRRALVPDAPVPGAGKSRNTLSKD
jgi:ketol-acid reductoisomerase